MCVWVGMAGDEGWRQKGKKKRKFVFKIVFFYRLAFFCLFLETSNNTISPAHGAGLKATSSSIFLLRASIFSCTNSNLMTQLKLCQQLGSFSIRHLTLKTDFQHGYHLQKTIEKSEHNE